MLLLQRKEEIERKTKKLKKKPQKQSDNMANDSEIRYLTPPTIETRRNKYCRFKKLGIKYIDYKDPKFLLRFINDQGKVLPRRLTGTSLKYQRKLSVALKRSRQLALLPYLGDQLK